MLHLGGVGGAKIVERLGYNGVVIRLGNNEDEPAINNVADFNLTNLYQTIEKLRQV